MKVYVAIDVDRVVGWHEEKRVVKTYATSVNASTTKRIFVRKVPKDMVKRVYNYQDLYLIRRGTTFIQSGFDDCDYDYKAILVELFFTKDILEKYQHDDDLTKEERKAFKKVLQYLRYKIEDTKDYVPTLEMLQAIKLDMEEYKYHASDLEIGEF